MAKQTKFREILKEVDLTASQIARRLGLRPNAVINWANGKTNPTIRDIVLLSRLIDVPIERLVLCFYEDRAENKTKKKDTKENKTGANYG